MPRFQNIFGTIFSDLYIKDLLSRVFQCKKSLKPGNFFSFCGFFLGQKYEFERIVWFWNFGTYALSHQAENEKNQAWGFGLCLGLGIGLKGVTIGAGSPKIFCKKYILRG